MFIKQHDHRGLFLVLLQILWLAGLHFGTAAGTAVAAGVIVDSGGFESPYAVGPLQWQFGWLNAGSGTTSATVQNAVAQSGSQAVLVTRTANSDQHWLVPDQVGFPTQRFVTVDWDMLVNGPSGNPLTDLGPYFGVDAYDVVGSFGLLGSLCVDATTGHVLYSIQDTADLTETGTILSLNLWHHFRLVFDFATDTYRGYVNGAQVSNTGFSDRGFGLDNFSDADIAAAGDPMSQSLSASAVFDNFLIRDGLVGDYDIDGDVDSADNTRWRTTFGTSISPAGNNADGNGNGVVDAADYVVWRENLGASLFSGSGSGSVVVAPEPAVLVLILIGLLPIAWLSARRRPVNA